MKNFVLLVVCMFVFCVSEKTQAQDEWQVGLGGGIVRLTDSLYTATLKEKHLFQIPRLSVTKRINEKLSVSGSISFNSIQISGIIDNRANYFSLDSFLRYSLMKDTPFIDPYAFVGASLVSIQIELTPTVNFGFGNTFWFLKNLGLNTQAMYKLSEKKTSHFQFTGGLVYNLSSGRKTLWHIKR